MKKNQIINRKQKCRTCLEYLDLDKFPIRKTSSGFGSKCLKCIDYHFNNKDYAIFEKKCKNCKKIILSTDFPNDSYSTDGKKSKCNICTNVQRKKYRETERSKFLVRESAKRRRKNIYFKLHAACSSNVTYSLLRKKNKKNNESILNYLPYTIEELKMHLQSLWEPWMNWENYGKASLQKKTWQIDHIVPVSFFSFYSMNDLQFIECWSLKNIRPLESIVNIKKRNKLEK